ncbi:MAG: efflux RND transporter periplasmic adaptor subunit, partial [Thermoplasmata archaeon]
DEFVKALADLNVSLRAYERARSLVDGKAISAGEFQSREASYLSKKVEAESAARTLRLYGEPDDEIEAVRASVESGAGSFSDNRPHRLAVRAPFNGRVIDRKVTPGSLVEALQPLATAADLSSVWVFLQAYEKDLALVQDGLPVTIRVDAYPQESFHGRIDFLASVVDAATRTVRVRANVQNPAEKLRPGMFVRAQIEVPKPKEETHPVLAVPQSALQTLEGRTNVFVESEPGVFVRRVVETGHTFEGFTEVLSGVKTGDVVVTEGSFVLKGEFARATLAEED